MLVLMTMLAMASAQPGSITPLTPIDTLRYYPPGAEKAGIWGSAVIACTLRISGDLENCQLASETPPGWGFGEAALKMAPTLHARPHSVNGEPYEGALKVPITFRFPETPSIAPVTVASAAPGSASINCRVGADTRFENCLLTEANPETLGDAAIASADNLRAPPSLAVGTRVEIPLVLAAPAP